MGQRGSHQQGVNIQRKDVGPGELSGDEAMAVSLLWVLPHHLQQVVYGADSELIWQEVTDIQEHLEFVLIEADLRGASIQLLIDPRPDVVAMVQGRG